MPDYVNGYTLEELSYKSLEWLGDDEITDDFYIRGCLDLKTSLNFISGATSGLQYDSYYYDPYYTEWKVQHEVRELFCAGKINQVDDVGVLQEYRLDNDFKRYDPETNTFIQPIAYYLIYDCKQWVDEMREKGWSSSTVKFKFRQVDFSPTLMISMTENMKKTVWKEYSNA